MDQKTYTYAQLLTKYKDFNAPGFEITVDGTTLTPDKFHIPGVEVEISAGGTAGGCSFSIEGQYDAKNSKWENNAAKLMQQLQEEIGMAIIMITHDLGVVAQLCDEVIVMYAGSICEQGTADEIFYNPRHEYTKGLMRSIPTADTAGQRLQPITGTPIDLLNMPEGCPFAPRCDAAMKICIHQRCERMEINADHAAACWMNVKAGVENGTIAAEKKQEGGEQA